VLSTELAARSSLLLLGPLATDVLMLQAHQDKASPLRSQDKASPLRSPAPWLHLCRSPVLCSPVVG